MATVTRENIGLLTDKLTVNVTKEDYYPAFEKSLKKISKTINIPGFRPGKVPVGMVKKMHGPAIFSEEVVNSIEKNLVEYLQKENLDLFGQALPTEDSSLNGLNMENPSDYSFSFEIGLRPEINLPDLKSVKLPTYKIEISEEMIDEEVERHRLRTGKIEEIAEIADDYDVLQLNFNDNKEATASAENAEGENQETEGQETKNGKSISVLFKYFSENAKNLLKGKKLNDSVELTIAEAFDGKEKSWIARDLGIAEEDFENKKFTITIEKLEHVTLSEFNEEFFKAAYPAEEIADEAGFRAVVRKEIEGYWNTQSRNHLEHEMYHILIDETKADFPEAFLKRWLKENPSQGTTNHDDPEEFNKFLKGLKWTLISEKIANEGNIKITEEELKKEALNQLMGYMGMNQASGDEPWINDYLDRVMKDERFISQTRDNLTTTKTLGWAADQINAAETKVSVEEFSNLIQEHNHKHH